VLARRRNIHPGLMTGMLLSGAVPLRRRNKLLLKESA